MVSVLNEILYQLWLAGLDKVSNSKMRQIYNEYGSFKKSYDDIDFDDFFKMGIPNASKSLDKASKILEDCYNSGIDIISYYDDAYPEILKQIPDAPMQLYVKGKLPPVDNVFSIAIVGARRSSIYGSNIANQIAYDLGRAGAVIVSGMARGIDTAAHRGALKAEADTVAVLGCGVDVVYPPENGELKKLIEAHGAVISEFPPGTPPMAGNFPARNRIISGISNATLIVEGKATSGSTITARLALEQGREVFCLPGNVDNPLSQGPHMLIRDNARLVTCAKDIIVDMSSDYPELMVDVLLGEDAQKRISDKKNAKLPLEQRQILAVLQANHPIHIDQICHITGIETAVVNQSLFMLEMNKMVKSLPGKQYILYSN